MFYPHTIKGKPFPRLDLISNPPIEPPVTGPPLANLQGWLRGDQNPDKDLSPNDHPVTQTAIGTGSTLNGHNTFDYQPGSFQSFGTAFGTPPSYTITGVIYIDSFDTINGLWGADAVGGNWGDTNLDYPLPFSNPGLSAGFSEASVGQSLNENLNAPLPRFSWHILTVRYSGTGPVTEFLVNGVLISSVQIQANATSNTGTPQIFNIGRAGVQGCVAFIADWLMYDTYLDGTNYTALIDYLTDRYNL